jgi:O-antigen ligase
MPTIPSGGLSIFVNLAILFFGYFIDLLKKFRILTKSSKTYSFAFDKEYDLIIRRMASYAMVLILFLVMFGVTSLSVYSRVKEGSNVDLIKAGVIKVATIYKNSQGQNEEDIESRKIKPGNLAVKN